MGSSSALDQYRDAELTLEELAETAARLLRRLEVRPGDGRVAPAPDVRSVRFYQTVGVVDRPLRYDGRRAIYGFRHLLQLLAVKRFQQEGHPLQLIQRSLAGCPTRVLEEALGTVIGGLGQSLQTGEGETPSPRHNRVRSRGSNPQASHAAALPSVLAPEAPIAAPTSQPTAPAGLIAARVAPGITVTIDPALVDDPGEILRRVAAALAAKES